MRTYNCDRCGEKFAVSHPMDPPTPMSADLTQVGLTTKLPRIGKTDRIVVVEVDLCGKCVEDLAKWASVAVTRRTS